MTAPTFSAESAPDDVAAIAAGLTDQMRGALMWPKGPRLEPRTLYSQTINGLQRRGLSDATYRLTPLGLSIRQHLLDNAHD